MFGWLWSWWYGSTDTTDPETKDHELTERQDRTGSDYLAVCAIDFGTSYSGYAFSYKAYPDTIYESTTLSGGIGSTLQVPTSVLTKQGENGDFVAFGYEAERKYDDHATYCLYKEFKMSLLNKKNLSRNCYIEAQNGQRREAMDIFVMAIKYLKTHFLQEASKQFEGDLKAEDVHWVITVPAIWSDSAKMFMREAAYKAGCIQTVNSQRLRLALEPEVAALFCRTLEIRLLQRRTNVMTLNFPPNTKYMIIDAGGGTIDIAVHQLLTNEKIKEIYAPSGAHMGSTKINQNFEKLLTKALGTDFINSFRKEHPNIWNYLMTTFERHKRTFSPRDNSSKMRISLPHAIFTHFTETRGSRDIEKHVNSRGAGNKWQLSKDNGVLAINFRTALELFESLINDITDFVRGILTKEPLHGTISHVLLVGGFGDCHLLQEKLGKMLEGISAEIQFLVPLKAHQAVVKGALKFGASPNAIESRIARKSYGTDVFHKYDPQVHDAKKKLTIAGKEWVEDVFDPFIIKNSSVKVGTIRKQRKTKVHPDQGYIAMSLYCTDKDELEDVEYIDEKYFQKVMEIPDIKVDRSVEVQFIFGETELQVKAINESNKSELLVDVEYFD